MRVGNVVGWEYVGVSMVRVRDEHKGMRVGNVMVWSMHWYEDRECLWFVVGHTPCLAGNDITLAMWQNKWFKQVGWVLTFL